MRVLTKFIPLLFSTLFTLMVIGLSGLAGLYLYYSPQLPDSMALHQIEMQVPLRIYSREERLIAEYGAQRSRPVDFEQIPKTLLQAFISIEDARYYDHPGIDLKGIARAMYSVISTGRASQGASTITMQLARNAFLDSDKTVERKFKETLLAIKLEQTLNKDEILELYLNKIYLGNRAYGIAAAAKVYYGKDKLEDLTLAQMAMIAGLPKAPSRYNPIVNPPRAMIRRDYILKRMLELGYIQRPEYEAAAREPNTASVHKTDIETYAPYLAEMVRSAIVEKYADKAYTQGYHVYTTLDSQMQIYATKALRETLDDYDKRHGYRGAEDHINLDDYAGRDEWLDKLSTYPQVGDMQAALVIKSTRDTAEVLLLNEQVINLHLEDVKWARKFVNADSRGKTPKNVNDVIAAGDIVRVRPVITVKTATKDKANSETAPTQPEQPTQWQLTQIPAVGGALVLMNPTDGAIRAVMGGYDFYHSKFNRATQAMRQPGSSFKPIIYSAALSKGFSPASIVNDAPINIPGSKWQPKNFGGKYIGPTTLREALAKSRNLVSIRILRDTGIPYTIDYATRFGYERKNLPPNLTLALGTGLTTPVQMATAYSTFANGGFKVDAHFINRIEDNDGNVLFDASTEIRHACGDNVEQCTIKPNTGEKSAGEKSTAEVPAAEGADKSKTETLKVADQAHEIHSPAAPRIMDSRTNYQIVSMMQGVTQFGTAASAGRTLKRDDIAGKTGTTNEQKDSWFCGFNQDYVAVAWSGFDDMAELGEGETSTRIAVPMWINLMQEVLKGKPSKKWQQPGKLQTVKIDADTGLLADQFSTHVIEEELTAEQAPTQTAQRFEFKDTVQVQVNNAGSETDPTAAPAPRRRTEAVEIPEQIF